MADEKEKDEQLPGQMNLFDQENPETDDQVNGEDEETCDDEACEPEEDAGGKKGKTGKKAEQKKETKPAAPAKPSASAPAPVTWIYPFNIRYAAEYITLDGFEDGKTYNTKQIREVLIRNGFEEFREMEIELHHSEATNTLVITIKGSRKGSHHG